MDDKKTGGQFPLPGIALVLVVLGVLVFSENPFKSSRPAPPAQLTSSPEQVLARLWQDPFDAVVAHRETMHVAGDILNFARLDSILYENVQYIDEYHRVCSFWDLSDESDIASVRRSIEKLKADNRDTDIADVALTKEIYALILSGAHTPADLRCRIQRDIDTKNKDNAGDVTAAGDDHSDSYDLHMLAMMVPGGPYAEDRETRIRSRYALITGLSNAGYVPSDAEHIGYLDFADLCRQSLKGLPVETKYCDWPAIVPYEWFELSEQRDTNDMEQYAENILVLWLSEEELAYKKPLRLLTRIIRKLTPGDYEINREFKQRGGTGEKKRLRIKHDVVGPASSTTLLAMYREIYDHACDNRSDTCDSEKAHAYFPADIRVISPRATMEDRAITRLLSQEEGFVIDRNFSFGSLLTLQRTIAEDKKLVEALICELMRRGVNPYQYRKGGSAAVGSCEQVPRSLNREKKQDHIILIGEWDTLYSRNFNNLFREAIGTVDGDVEITWLHSYNYFRGIDGTPGNDEVQPGRGKNSSKESGEKSSSLRRPVGSNQFDYLRRLGDRLKELSASIEGDGNIRAIGIVGSDTYDKLLVLQALRARFPSVVFFTTDLDARMLHEEENDWARNLVVASGYDLAPEQEAFAGAPFRDAYQTSLFIAAKHAVLVDDRLSETMPVSIFEVGNRGAVNYSQPGLSDSPDESHCETTGFLGAYGMYLVAAAILFIFLAAQSSTRSRRVVFIGGLSLVLVSLWLTLLNTTDSLEFRAMWTGTSVWPAIVMRMIAAVLALIFVAYVLESLRKNNSRLIRDYEIPLEEGTRFYDRVVDRFRQYSFSRDGLAEGLDIVRQEVTAAFQAQHSSRYFDQTVINRYQLQKPSIWAHLLITLWGWRYEAGSRVNLDNLVYQYLEMGRTRWWVSRVLIMYILYILFVVVFMSTNPGFISTPYSDAISASANQFVLRASVLGYLFLIFLVVDVTRLYAQFLDLLSRCNVTWPQACIDKYCQDYGVSEAVGSEKLKLDLIVQRSRAVDVMIFLPFVILSLMILSRSGYFDRWHMPVHLGVIILLGAMIALSSAIRLRRAANRARRQALERLEDMYNRQLYTEAANAVEGSASPDTREHDMSSRIKIIIDDIHSIDAGPFVPITRHPILTAIAMPFGGVGGLYLIDYIATAGL